jgi:hypothetical protein
VLCGWRDQNPPGTLWRRAGRVLHHPRIAYAVSVVDPSEGFTCVHS